MTKSSPRRFEMRIAVIAIALAVPSLLFGIGYLSTLPIGLLPRCLLGVTLVAALGALIHLLTKTIRQPLQGLASVVEAYRGGDYSLRGGRALQGDVLGDLVFEINALGGTLHEQRLKAMEATALLDKLIGAIEVAIIAFDADKTLRLVNPAAAQLLDLSDAEMSGRTARELGLDTLLTESPRTQIVTSVAGRTGRWQVVRGTFRDGGLVQNLLIISDVQHALREEERAAWQRLIRVIGHEVNNSLAPIKSMSESLQSLLAERLDGSANREEILGALKVIAERTGGLSRFLGQYSRLAKFPPPRPHWQPISEILNRVVALEPLRRVEIKVPTDFEAFVDSDQLEQALINLAKNAVEASIDGEASVSITADVKGSDLIILIVDEGQGISNPDNLFVPFFTTKQGGSGVGLALSRQIAEAHGGTLSLENRTDRSGAIATVRIPNVARTYLAGNDVVVMHSGGDTRR